MYSYKIRKSFPTYNKSVADTLKIFIYLNNMETLKKREQLLNKVGNIVTKEEIAHSFARMFTKVVCCRGIRKSQHVGKG